MMHSPTYGPVSCLLHDSVPSRMYNLLSLVEHCIFFEETDTRIAQSVRQWHEMRVEWAE
jgi:hypothetical protein